MCDQTRYSGSDGKNIHAYTYTHRNHVHRPEDELLGSCRQGVNNITRYGSAGPVAEKRKFLQDFFWSARHMGDIGSQMSEG